MRAPIAILTFAFGCSCLANPPPATNAATVAKAIYEHACTNVPFSINGTVTAVCGASNSIVGVEDESGAAILHLLLNENANPAVRPGDRLNLVGATARERGGCTVAFAKTVAVLGHVAPPEPIESDAADIFSGKRDCRLVRVSGIVRDIFRDDIDADWTVIVLGCGSDNLYLALCAPSNTHPAEELAGTEVSVIGLCGPIVPGRRRLIRRLIRISSTNDIAILRRPVSQPFSAPQLEDPRLLRADMVPTLGRRRVIGRVLATWHGDTALVRTENGETIQITTATERLPTWNACIEAEGIPITDLFRVNLVRAVWRESTTSAHDTPSEPEAVSAANITTDTRGQRAFDATCHGRLLRLRGLVRSLSPEGYGSLMMIEDGLETVAVDIGTIRPYASLPDVGSVINVTGVCIIETDTWSPNSMFPRVNGFRLVVRTPDDIQLIAAPPWWTPKRLLIAIVSLLLVLFAILIWNFSLKALVERRSRELLREQVARLGADMKVDERTRLAVDLHDSVAQNLSGVSMRIDAARKMVRSDPDKAERILNTASGILLSSREELRNCLWDLRSQALEAADMEEAIRLTLKPHIDETDISIHFDAPRAWLSDNTAHTVLCIIRELVINAIRHGRAQSVDISGRTVGHALQVSVHDDGKGFDPTTAPGTSQGHFGLQGIRDRLHSHGGSLAIDSQPGQGTTATILLS